MTMHMMAVHGKILFFGGCGTGMGTSGNFSGASDGMDVWQPAADLIEIEGGFLVQVDLPGVDVASVEAVVDDQTLFIKGLRRAICPSQSKRYVHMEVARGEFSKTISLPEPVEQDNANAILRDGVLEIFLPCGKRPQYSVTSIRIKPTS